MEITCSLDTFIIKAVSSAEEAEKESESGKDLYIKKSLVESLMKSIQANPKFSNIIFVWVEKRNITDINFYKKVLELQKKYLKNKSYQNILRLQVSGFFNSDFLKFLSENDFTLQFNVKKSVFTKYDKFELSEIADAANKIQKRKIPVETRLIIDTPHIECLERIYEFFKLHEVAKVSIVAPRPNNGFKPDSYHEIQASDYGNNLCALFDSWCIDVKNGEAIPIDIFNSVLTQKVTGKCTLMSCEFWEKCINTAFIEHDGKVYLCEAYSTPEYSIGSIEDEDLNSIFNSENYLKLSSCKTKYPKECAECKWLEFCHGGCPKNRSLFNKSKTSYFCDGYKMFFEYVMKKVDELAEQIDIFIK